MKIWRLGARVVSKNSAKLVVSLKNLHLKFSLNIERLEKRQVLGIEIKLAVIG
jgi:hypothetical protein